MNLIKKIILKIKIETRFFLEQKYGLKKPADPFSISKSALKKYLVHDPVIVDCGAHVGADSVELAKIFPKGRVHSFEPVPAIFEQLKQNARKYSNIFTYQLALSNKNGSSNMFVSSGSSDASSSLLKPTGHLNDHPDTFFNNSIEVKTQTLDRWANENNIERIDFLWLDMQGFELNMLKSSPNALKTVSAIHSEVSIKETYEAVVLYEEYRQFLEANGFVVEKEAIPPGCDMGNVLFVRK